MSELNIVWRKYNLKDDPYFIRPLEIENERTAISLLFIGREKEKEDILNKMSSGRGSILVVGDAGVGKTSFVNYIRSKSREGQFFSPSTEIEINYAMSCQEFLVATLNAIYREAKTLNIFLSSEITEDLENIYDLSKITTNDAIDRLSYERLKELFLRTVREVVHPRHKGIILHYDNLDNIEDTDEIPLMFGEIRDLLIADNVITIFVGNKFLPDYIGYKRRIRDAIHFPPIEIKGFTLDDTKQILKQRIDYLTMDNRIKPETPHTEEAINILFYLYDGNLRSILRSLSKCVLEHGKSNNPLVIDENTLRKTLVENVKKDYLNDLTTVEKKVLLKMLEYNNPITPTELSKMTKIRLQNISSKYLLKLRQKTAIEIVGKEGRNVYYQIRPEIKWLRLEDVKKEESNKAKEFMDKKLTDYK